MELSPFWQMIALCGCAVALAATLGPLFVRMAKSAMSGIHRMTWPMISLALACVVFGSDKGKVLTRYILIALAGGGLFDPSGTVASKTEADTVSAFQRETGRILEGSRNSVTGMVATAAAMTNSLAEGLADAYVAADWPASIPSSVHGTNIAAVIEKTQEADGGTNIEI